MKRELCKTSRMKRGNKLTAIEMSGGSMLAAVAGGLIVFPAASLNILVKGYSAIGEKVSLCDPTGYSRLLFGA